MISCNYLGQDCAELHSPYENVVVAGKNPSPQVILHGFLLVTMRVLNSYEKTKERTVSVVEIQEFMEQQGNPVNVSTIYRNLDALVAQGQVMKFVSDKGDKDLVPLQFLQTLLMM